MEMVRALQKVRIVNVGTEGHGGWGKEESKG